jgi:hypothetical protein
MNIKNIIKEVVEEVFFKEDALRASSLPDEVGLFVRDLNRGYTLTLYNPANEIAFATITINYDPNEGPGFYVSGVAAEKGFGPFIYELAMMHIDSGGDFLMPSRDGDVKGSAFNVWYKFYDRDDVDKETLDLFDENFRCDIIVGNTCVFDDDAEKQEWWNESSDDEKKALLVFNTGYSIEEGPEYHKLISIANNYPEEIQDKAYEAGDELWQDKY